MDAFLRRPLAVNLIKPKLKLKSGLVIKVYYFLVIKQKKKRYFEFIGLCLSVSKSKGNFILLNTWNNELIQITFSFYTPYILRLIKHYKYDFFFRISKIFFRKKIRLTDDYRQDILTEVDHMLWYNLPRILISRVLNYGEKKRSNRKVRLKIKLNKKFK